ncbi:MULTISPECIES: hypothetical protein [unclassified Sinorhizobium]|uniref:hypothetical protein n=1 Tax=unclassified Sinorhizobium TaxID=2613772 RepID=UPI0024C23B00|nr:MULTISPECIES: hypothetical protein [unclassified Sinorhizobium]MDK1374344.1 hypothetical protein [Sinorhizobium sp. 6-70]MDK1482239.1 hypothetical protein [Sinorhizobium sp. 6-117]
MSIRQRSRLRRRLFALLAAGLGGIAAAAISFAMAVYDAATPNQVPVVAPGEPVDTGRWVVTIHEAYLSPIPPTGTKPFEPDTFLVLEFDLDNRSAATSNAFHELISIEKPSPAALPGPTYYLARDKWIASAINPNMPERLIAVWELSSGTPVPQSLQLKLRREIYKQRDNLYGSPGWFEDGAAAMVELAVTQGRKGAPL